MTTLFTQNYHVAIFSEKSCRFVNLFSLQQQQFFSAWDKWHVTQQPKARGHVDHLKHYYPCTGPSSLMIKCIIFAYHRHLDRSFPSCIRLEFSKVIVDEGYLGLTHRMPKGLNTLWIQFLYSRPERRKELIEIDCLCRIHKAKQCILPWY